MNTKEKAHQLYMMFSNTCYSYLEGKKCAIKCVEEILKTYNEIDPKLIWWYSVKQELEKI